jgi:LysM repeat protein
MSDSKAAIWKWLNREGSSQQKVLECPFNPSQLSYGKSASYERDNLFQKDEPKESFKGGDAASLSLELFFDTTQETIVAKKNVHTTFVEKLIALEKYDSNQGGPPYCQFEWGVFKLGPLIVKSVNATYTLFLSNGTPVRARVTLGMESVAKELTAQNPTSGSDPRRTWVVVEGETLDWIAYQEYGSAAHWRHIAETNDLLNPRDLRPGQILKLVPLP